MISRGYPQGGGRGEGGGIDDDDMNTEPLISFSVSLEEVRMITVWFSFILLLLLVLQQSEKNRKLDNNINNINWILLARYLTQAGLAHRASQGSQTAKYDIK